MHSYLTLLQDVLDNGVDRGDRTGTGTRAVFGRQLRFDMREGFPAVTTKKLAFKTLLAELLWFLRGSRNVNELRNLNCRIWDGNVEADYWKPHQQFDGDAGRIYGVQWRNWETTDGHTIDQLADAVEQIKHKPHNRRIIVTAWNPGDLDYYEEGKMTQTPNAALAPCHILFQFFVADGKLSLQMYQRSCDIFLGVPFNIASYSLLLHMIAAITDLEPGDFVHTYGDLHIYHNHFEQVKEQLQREPYDRPTLKLNPAFERMQTVEDLDAFLEQIFNEAAQLWHDYDQDTARKKVYALLDSVASLQNYEHHPPIKAPMAV